MSSTSMNLTKIPVVPGYDDPSPCPSPSDRCTSCGDVDAFGGTMSCPSCSKSFCPSCFPPTQHEPCRQANANANCLRGMAGMLASAVGTSGYLGLCAAKHHLQLTGAPVDSAVAEKDKETGVRAVELPRGIREDHQAVHRLDV